MYTNAGGSATTMTTGWDLRGLSTDTKPTGSQIPNGSSFLEMDTGSVYFWDKENSQWRAV